MVKLPDIRLTVVVSKHNDETSLWNRLFVDGHTAWKYYQECEAQGGDMRIFEVRIEDTENIEKLYADVNEYRRQRNSLIRDHKIEGDFHQHKRN